MLGGDWRAGNVCGVRRFAGGRWPTVMNLVKVRAAPTLRKVLVGASSAAAVAVSGLIVFVCAAVFTGGLVYRTDCISDTGQLVHTWRWEGGNIPYLWASHDPRCEAHTLTRYVLGKVGIAGDIDH